MPVTVVCSENDAATGVALVKELLDQVKVASELIRLGELARSPQLIGKGSVVVFVVSTRLQTSPDYSRETLRGALGAAAGRKIVSLRMDDALIPPLLEDYEFVDVSTKGLEPVRALLAGNSGANAGFAQIVPREWSGGRILQEQDEIRIEFDSDMDEEQITGTLTALANYFRACGGVGLASDFQTEVVAVEELVDV
jgi:hypothetical protein